MNIKQVILNEVQCDALYEGRVNDHVVTLGREQGESPNGNPFNGCWVLRVDGEFIDHGQYRFDVAGRHRCILENKKEQP